VQGSELDDVGERPDVVGARQLRSLPYVLGDETAGPLQRLLLMLVDLWYRERAV